MPFVGSNKATVNLQNPSKVRLAVVETRLNARSTTFHIMIEDEFNHFSLIRFPQDFIELNNLFKSHFPKDYIPLPKLKDKRALRFSFSKKKSNASLIETYLSQCLSSKIANTSLFHDFLSCQRSQDLVIPKPSVAQLKRKRLSTLEDYQHKKIAFYADRHDSGLTLSTKDHKSFGATSQVCDTIRNYELIRVLGRGATGKVMLVRHHQSRHVYALKAMAKSWSMTQREVDHIRRERDILSLIASLHHPFLIRLHAAFQDTENLYLVMDYHAGADLATLLQRHARFPMDQCRLYAAEIVMGLQELHRQCILYRDLKPENILVAADGHLVLTDFGLSKMFDRTEEDHRTMTFCGTPEYLAPEIILHESKYSYAADYWSLGTMLYEMIAGVIPFAADDMEDMYDRVLYDDLFFPDGLFDAESVDFIIGLLDRDPYQRLGAGPMGVFDIRTHPFFARHLDWKDVYAKRIEPAFVPVTSGETDLTYFDPEFLNMSIDLYEEQGWSEIPPVGLSKDAFQGYSFMDNDSSMVSYDSEISFYNTHDIINYYIAHSLIEEKK